MAWESVQVAAGADDWDSVSTTGQRIYAYSVYNIPPLTSTAYANIDLSHINSTETIYAAELWWYTHSYSKSRTLPTNTQFMWLWNGTYWDLFWIYVSPIHPGTGWKSSGAFSAYEISKLTKGVNQFRFTVGNAGFGSPGDFYNWQIRAYEYGSDYQVYLRVRHGYTEETAVVSIVGA